MKIQKETIKTPLIIWSFFIIIGILFWKIKGSLFFLFNFGYIGSSVCIGMILSKNLPNKKKVIGRKITQLLVGIYMLGFLGVLGKENMQIEGFFMLFISGIFSGAVIHYLVAKIFGTLLFNRAWCGYACWTAMILDFLPYTKPQEKRLKYYGIIRYAHFVLSIIFVVYFVSVKKIDVNSAQINLIWLLVGNIFYYVIGISLAYLLKDNRAFCKYICPIVVFQKILCKFALMKVKINKNKCIDCKLCEKECPMNIKLLSYKEKNQRILSSECIICSNCINVCPKNAIDISFKIDYSIKNEIDYK